MLWLLFDKIDLTIGFERVEIGWVRFFAGLENVRLAASFYLSKYRLCQKLTHTFGPSISKSTPPFDSFCHTDHNGGLCLCRFYSENCLNLRADFAVRIHRVTRQA